MKKIILVLLFIGLGITSNNVLAQDCYKKSYSTGFKCYITSVALGGGLYETIKSCSSQDYARGYEDAWNRRSPEVLLSLVTKAFQGASCLAYEDQSCPSPSAEEISYTRGYTDGEADRRCQDQKDREK